MQERKRRGMFSWLLLGLAGALLLFCVALLVGSLLLVEDWSRDLAQNHAATADDHADPRLRTLALDLPPSAAAELVEAAVKRLPRWNNESRSTSPPPITLRLTRRTPLWRFVDDITVTLEPRDGKTILRAESQSRVGQGDLGQNPRNLRELLDACRRAVAERGSENHE